VVTKTRKNIHLLRKFFHALAGILMAGTHTTNFSSFLFFCFKFLHALARTHQISLVLFSFQFFHALAGILVGGTNTTNLSKDKHVVFFYIFVWQAHKFLKSKLVAFKWQDHKKKMKKNSQSQYTVRYRGNLIGNY
jgi:hypothetical protein